MILRSPWLFVQKWKQLSRLQRSLILLTLMLLLVCGIAISPSLIEHWRGEPLHNLISLSRFDSEAYASSVFMFFR